MGPVQNRSSEYVLGEQKKKCPKMWKKSTRGGGGWSAPKIKKTTDQNVDYFETRRGKGWIFKFFPNSNEILVKFGKYMADM